MCKFIFYYVIYINLVEQFSHLPPLERKEKIIEYYNLHIISNISKINFLISENCLTHNQFNQKYNNNTQYLTSFRANNRLFIDHFYLEIEHFQKAILELL